MLDLNIKGIIKLIDLRFSSSEYQGKILIVEIVQSIEITEIKLIDHSEIHLKQNLSHQTDHISLNQILI